ncbi:class I SAM-dependent methyltransferase [Streptomyces sp. NPDC047097]|uniref:class I SAM-dependent methyltransferase n=1 Tax=Streptomyces sp. NPDC047097 TaxID=3155260 RepID=UPI0033CDC622
MPPYDAIASQYKAINDRIRPFRENVESPSFQRVVGDVRGLSVLDVACGDGWYSRRLARAGARVIGVDISAEMVREAERQTTDGDLDIEYRVGDAAALGIAEKFPLITAAYLLHYAATRDDLAALCRGLRARLDDGGRLVTLVLNPHFDPRGPSTAAYGLELRTTGETGDGALTRLHVDLEPPVTIDAYRWRQDTYEAELENAGFVSTNWTPLTCSQDAAGTTPDGYWDDYLANPTAVALECVA